MNKKKRDSQIIQLESLKDNSVVFQSSQSITYAPKKMEEKKLVKDQPMRRSLNSRILPSNDREGSINSRRDTIKDISKGALYLLKQKSLLFSNIFENEEKKQEIKKRIGKRQSLRLGYASGLLLEKKAKETNIKLSLSRRKTRLEQFTHTQYLFNCKVQALLAMATILTSIIEYENTVLSVGHEKVIHTFHPYDFEAYAYNINADYFRRLGRVAQICSYFSFLLSIFLWISMYYDKILFHILINGYQDKSIKIIIGQWRRLFRFILNIFFCFFCPNPFTYKTVIHFHSEPYSIKYEVPLNSIFTSICLFRIWYIFKLYLVSSESYSQRSFRISKINGVQLGLKFPFKANMTDSSLLINFTLFFMCWLVCSYDLRIFERYFDELNDSNLGNYFSPKSLLGRIIIIISCMFGVFLVGLMVVSVTSYLNIVGVESNVYKILLKSNKMEYRNQLAFKAIAQYLKSINEVKKERNMASKDIFLNKVVPTQKKQIHHHLKNFKIADSDFLQTIPSLNEYDNISDHLRFLEENMSKNQDKVVEIVDLLDQLNSVFHNA